jgi:hypothetical protein
LYYQKQKGISYVKVDIIILMKEREAAQSEGELNIDDSLSTKPGRDHAIQSEPDHRYS